MRQKIDDYLDEALEPAERAELERRISADPALARLLASMKQERALRAAAYASFQPAPQEARTFASNMLDSLTAPLPAGYVGVWIKRGLAVAAAIAVVAGSFAMGRMTASTSTGQTAVVVPPKSETQVVYRVIYFDEYGEKEVREFASLDETNDFVSKLDSHRNDPKVAVVDLSSPGSL
jgi:anti-sigma factor RsiW